MSNFIEVGRLGKDSVKTYNQAGKAMLKFSVAYDLYQGKDKPAISNWVNVTLWENYAEAMESILTKGTLVKMEGDLILEKREWEGKTYHNLVLMNAHIKPLGGKKDSNTENGNGHSHVSNAGGSDDPFATRSEPSFVPELAEDEVPF